MDNFVVQTFGVSPMTFAIVVVFWAFVFAMFFGEGVAATFATCIFTSITAWLIGRLGAVLFILLVVAVVGGAIYFLFRNGGQSTTPIYQPTVTSNYSAFSGSSAAYGSSPPYQSTAKFPPTVLYHGTKTLKAARDILTHNRWLTKSHYPHGVYLSDDFYMVFTYAGLNGIVVEVNSSITSSMIVEFHETTLNSDQLLKQGFRLIRDGNIFTAPTPANTNGQYIRIEGLVPFRILDRNRNPISFNN